MRLVISETEIVFTDFIHTVKWKTGSLLKVVWTSSVESSRVEFLE